MTYDGFISYSHAADDLLAPRLQAGLQRFAKPWWKRRALRIFRDESSLSANPHLWESIVEAMDESEWLVLLLSPDAAESEWVNREIEYWKAGRDVSRILPVITDGSFAWRDGEVAGSAVPPALRDVFGGEPRWVDMRFAHSDVHLDLKNPDFLDAVADIASTLRGIPKDELASEEVRQHRKTMRTAWVAGAALVAVSIAAVAFALQANEQRAIAEENERRAEANAAEAQRNADAEAKARQDAEVARADAEFEAAVSEMRALTGWSSAELDRNPELATLLALLATALAPDQRYENEARDELREAIAANRLLARFENPSTLAWPHNYGVITADGTTVYAVQTLDVGNRVVSIDVESGEVLERFHESNTDDLHTRWVAISVSGILAFDVTSRDGDGYVQVVDTSTRATRSLPRDGCQDLPIPPHFSPDGHYLTFMNGTDECGAGRPEADWAVIYDTRTWDRVIWSRPDADYESIQFGAGSDRALLTSCDSEFLCLLELVSYPDLEPIESRRGFNPNLGLSGDRLAYLDVKSESAFGETLIVNLDSGGIAGIEEDPNQGWLVLDPFPYFLSPTGDLLAVRTASVRVGVQTVRIVRAEDGVLVGELPDFAVAPLGDVLVHVAWAEGGLLLTSSAEGLLLWDAAPVTERAIRADVEDLVDLGLETLTRGLTPEECSRFALSMCLSLDELRNVLLGSG